MPDTPQVLDPAALQAEIDNNANVLLLQITSEPVFAQARIPGALLVQPAELVCGTPPATGRLPDVGQLEALVSRIGLLDEHHVVVYDDEGGGWAGRMAWTLDVIGHRHWSYLNGGLQAWHSAGLPLESGAPEPPTNRSRTVTVDTSPIAEIPDVLAAIENPDAIIWDVRSAQEYRGEKQAAARVGHIPGAVNRDWLALKQADQRLADDLEDQLNQLGLVPGKAIITHCQTHHRSGLSYMIGRLYGLNIRAYHGSWSEWGNRDDTPINLGDTP